MGTSWSTRPAADASHGTAAKYETMQGGGEAEGEETVDRHVDGHRSVNSRRRRMVPKQTVTPSHTRSVQSGQGMGEDKGAHPEAESPRTQEMS